MAADEAWREFVPVEQGTNVEKENVEGGWEDQLSSVSESVIRREKRSAERNW